MTDIWERLRKDPELSPEIREEIERGFGRKGKSALDAIDAGRVKKYLDFVVVEGRTSSYIIEDDFCTCGDFLYRGRACWHLLAARVALAAGRVVSVDLWYLDQMAPGRPGAGGPAAVVAEKPADYRAKERAGPEENKRKPAKG
jgi:predicted nucleic acid-binding Zn finger protein